jgi:hypothetical protein
MFFFFDESVKYMFEEFRIHFQTFFCQNENNENIKSIIHKKLSLNS